MAEITQIGKIITKTRHAKTVGNGKLVVVIIGDTRLTMFNGLVVDAEKQAAGQSRMTQARPLSN